MNLSLTCPDDPCYLNYECDIEKQGRIIAAVFVKKSAASLVNKTSATLWLNSLFQLALTGDAILMLGIAGEKPRPETAELPGRGMQINKPGAKTHTLNLFDMQVVGNIDFYNKMLKTAQNYDLYYFTPALIWDASGQTIMLIGDPVIQNDLNQYISGEVTVKWSQIGNPTAEDFDTNTLLAGLNYVVTGLTSISGTVGNAGNTSYTAALNYDLGSVSLPDVVWSLEGAEASIDALAATIDATTGELEINPIDAGEFTISVVATSATGCIIGSLEVLVTVTE